MKKTSLILAKIAYIIAAAFLAWLALNAAHYTFQMNLYYYEGISFITENPDSRLRNLFSILVFGGIIFLLGKLLLIKTKDDEAGNRRVLVLSTILSAGVLVLLTVFVCKTRFTVESDQYEVFEIAKLFARGDFSPVSDYYIQMYDQQLGLALVESLFLHFTENHLIFQVMNALFVSLTLFFLTRLSHELFEKPLITFYTLMLSFLCFPLYYYVSFVYGDVYMMFSYIFISWTVVKWFKTKRTLYPLLFMITAIFLVPVRKNALVFLIALAIVMLLRALFEKRALPLLFGALAIIIPLLTNYGIKSFCEAKGNTSIENPMPAINWIAMGLYPETGEGTSVGVYNMMNELLYFNAERNADASKEAAKEYINSRIKEFKADNRSAYSFFRYKLCEQWIEPTYSSIDSTVGINRYCWEEVKHTYDFHTLDNMCRAMNYLQFFVYGFAFLYCIFLIKHDSDLGSLLPVVAFIGGLIFSIIWEASGRYVFPYYLLLIPMAGSGAGKVLELIGLLFKKNRSNKDGKSGEELNCNP